MTLYNKCNAHVLYKYYPYAYFDARTFPWMMLLLPLPIVVAIVRYILSTMYTKPGISNHFQKSGAWMTNSIKYGTNRRCVK